MHGGLRQRHVAPQRGLIHRLAKAQAGGAHQPAEVRQSGDGGDVQQVPLQIGAQIALEPDGAFGGMLHMHRRHRKAAAPHQLSPVFGGNFPCAHDRWPVRIGVVQQFIPYATLA